MLRNSTLERKAFEELKELDITVTLRELGVLINKKVREYKALAKAKPK